jgi:hypothetical protein
MRERPRSIVDAKVEPPSRLRLEERARRLRLAKPGRHRLINSAKHGNAGAGRAILQHAAVALRDALRGLKIMEADTVALEHLHDCLMEFQKGVKIERAFCVESGRGNPRRRGVVDNAILVGAVDSELKKQSKVGGQLNVTAALNRVAIRYNCSSSTVRAAWQRSGGLKKSKNRLEVER